MREHPDEDAARIAGAFFEARRQWRVLADYPGAMPRLPEAGYAIQDAAIALDGDAVVGWKLGRIAGGSGPEDRLAGPIFARGVACASPPPAMPVFAGGFAAAEAEFVLRTSAPPPPGQTAFTIAEATALVAAVRLGIEIASSPFPGINDHGAAVTIADLGNNHGLVLGDAVPGWATAALCDWPVTLAIDGAIVGRGSAATMLDGPFGSLRFLLEHLARRGIALPAGSLISTGAITGVHPVRPGSSVEARFGERGRRVACRIVAGRR